LTALRFRLAGFPVEILPNALVLAGVFFLLGLSWGWSLPLILAMIGIAIGSVLFHELGHATVAKLFRLEPIEITLHGFGGLTRHAPSPSAGRDLVIILAGPGFGMILAGLGFAATLAPWPPALHQVFHQLVFLNILWSVFNLLPIFPLDGGQALSAFLRLFLAPTLAWGITWGLGFLGALALAVYALLGQELFVLFFAGMFAWQNLQMLRVLRGRSQKS